MRDIAIQCELPIKIIDIRRINMEYILIRNEDGNYSKWVVYDYDIKRDCYHIALDKNKAIISSIGKSKIIEKDGKFYSDDMKINKEKYDFAFTSFGTINNL